MAERRIVGNVEYYAKFSRYVTPLVRERGWSYESKEDGMRIYDNLGVAGDHWDGKTFDEFFSYNEAGLRDAIRFCEL